MVFYLLIALCALLTTILIIMAAVSRYQNYKIQKTGLMPLPGPIGLPVLGSSAFIGKYKNSWDGFSALRKIYGDVYGITLGSTKCIVVSTSEAIKEILISRAHDFDHRPDFLRFHAIFRGNRNISIALCNWTGKQVKRRAIAFPFMHPKNKTFGDERMGLAIDTELTHLIKSLDKHVNARVFPRFQLMCFTANIFYQFICSTRYDLKDKKFREVVNQYDIVLKELFTGYAVDFMPWMKPFHWSKLKYLNDLSQDIGELIQPAFQSHALDLDKDNPRDLIDLLLIHVNSKESGKNALTMKEAEIIIDDLIGGSSALGNMMLWALYLLATDSSVQYSIREEICHAIFPEIKGVGFQHRNKLQYTEATVLEVIRIVSSPIIPHVSNKDTSVQGFHVPQNTLVLFNTYDQNMDEKYWKEPRTFNPERFLDEDGNVKKPDFFLPFGTGKRSCLGDKLVRATMTIALAEILSNFEIVLPERAATPSLHDIPGIVIPKEEISLKFLRTTIYGKC